MPVNPDDIFLSDDFYIPPAPWREQSLPYGTDVPARERGFYRAEEQFGEPQWQPTPRPEVPTLPAPTLPGLPGERRAEELFNASFPQAPSVPLTYSPIGGGIGWDGSSSGGGGGGGERASAPQVLTSPSLYFTNLLRYAGQLKV